MRAWDFPKDPVVIACTECDRRGQYTKARFLELVGRDASITLALATIAKDCPKAGDQTSVSHERCKAYFPDLIGQ